MILTVRTDKPESEIGLYSPNREQKAYEIWAAHRELSATIHQKIRDLLQKQMADWPDITGVVIYEGPGSFTGLRIGFSVANALGYGLQIPVAAVGGEDWITAGLTALESRKDFKPVEPQYGAPVHITQPRK